MTIRILNDLMLFFLSCRLSHETALSLILRSRPLRSQFEGWPNCEGLE
jgi:hypothetical protein